MFEIRSYIYNNNECGTKLKKIMCNAYVKVWIGYKGEKNKTRFVIALRSTIFGLNLILLFTPYNTILNYINNKY